MDINTPIVDAHGRQVFTFGGPNAYATYIYKGYLVSMEWFVGLRSTEPMMVIRNAKQGHEHGAVGICLSSIGKYADPDTGSNAARGAIKACYEHLDCLGAANLPIEANRLLDVILQYAPALILMPPTPRDVVREAMPDPIIDVTITHEDSGKTHSEVSL